LPAAEKTAGEVLSLPIFPTMSDAQVACVCAAVQQALGGKEYRVA
jgi:dTDP-4-amino-4,6-dideoxygalactose transaminase